MDTNFLCVLPTEISTIIFWDLLDEKSRFAFSKINKTAHNFIFGELLMRLRIDAVEGWTPYSQVMQHYKEHCEYFRKKLPATFQQINCSTLIEAKIFIDSKLAARRTFKGISLLNEIWNAFINAIDPNEDAGPSRLDSLHRMEIKAFIYNNRDKEAQMLLRAGAQPNQIGYYNSRIDQLASVLKQPWCTFETAELLVQPKIEITPKAIIKAIKEEHVYANFEAILPTLFAAVKSDDYAVRQLLEKVPASHQSFVESYIKRISNETPYDTNEASYDKPSYNVRLALEKKYPEASILQLLERYPKGVEAYHVRLALENKYSEPLILKLLHKCSNNIGEYHIRLAIENLYSSDFIKQLVAKVDTKKYNGEMGDYLISIALDSDYPYPEDLIDCLLDKVKESTLVESLTTLMGNGNGSYNKLVEKFLPKVPKDTNEKFDPWIFRFMIRHGYSEKVFVKVFEMTEQEEAIKHISLSEVITSYSETTVELLIDKGIKACSSDLHQALEHNYSEELINKIIDRVQSVESNSIKLAKAKRYSSSLIKKMQDKCTGSYCILS